MFLSCRDSEICIELSFGANISRHFRGYKCTGDWTVPDRFKEELGWKFVIVSVLPLSKKSGELLLKPVWMVFLSEENFLLIELGFGF